MNSFSPKNYIIETFPAIKGMAQFFIKKTSGNSKHF